MQIAACHVKRQIGAVDNAAQHQHIFGYNLFNVIVGDENLIVEEFDLPLKVFVLGPDARDKYYAAEVELDNRR